MKNFSIFGITGKIGSFTLDILRSCQDKTNYSLFLIAANSNIHTILDIIEEFTPKYVFLFNNTYNTKLNSILENKSRTIVIKTIHDLFSIYKQIDAKDKKNHFIINALLGFNGIIATFISQHFSLFSAIANKESIIISHEFFSDFNPSLIFPLDSEHYSIFKLLKTSKRESIKTIFITASGGKVFNKSSDKIKNLTVSDILHHPNWNMGKRITIDSSTGVNKAFELIEASALFELSLTILKVMISPKSQIHGILQTKQNEFFYTISHPDMHLSILSFFNYIELENSYVIPDLNITTADYTLYEPNQCFPIVDYIKNNYTKREKCGTLLIILNKILQDLFLNESYSFYELYSSISTKLDFMLSAIRKNNHESIDIAFSFTNENDYINCIQHINFLEDIVTKIHVEA